MAHFQVKWTEDRTNPRASHWYTLNGVITHTSPMLKDWVGGDHVCLVRYLHRRGHRIVRLSSECVPPTLIYHKHLLDTVSAVVNLLENKHAEDGLRLR
jgi:hypothetical protein